MQPFWKTNIEKKLSLFFAPPVWELFTRKLLSKTLVMHVWQGPKYVSAEISK